MATLQVKNLPDDLHARLRERAGREGVSLSEYVTRLIRRDLALPTMTEWLDQQSRRPRLGHDIDVTTLLDEVREDYDPLQ